MADKSRIEWTDATWNPIVGCKVLTPGCTNCYAMRLAGTRMASHPTRRGLTIDTKAGPVWNGDVRFLQSKLREPLQWSKPRMIFVGAHTDLWYEGVSIAHVDRVFAIMALANQHQYQVLTKRSYRMMKYLNDPETPRRIYDLVCEMAVNERLNVTLIAMRQDEGLVPPGRRVRLGLWPLPNVWVGISAEDQKRLDERLPHLLASAAAIRWVSAEPLLGPLNFRVFNDDLTVPKELHWVVAGGESGPQARWMHSDWVRLIRDHCEEDGAAFLFKQWGEWLPTDQDAGQISFGWHDKVEMQGGLWTYKVGKKRAGRTLDGKLHDGYPEIRRG